MSDDLREQARQVAELFRNFTKSSHRFHDGRPLHLVAAEVLEQLSALPSSVGEEGGEGMQKQPDSVYLGSSDLTGPDRAEADGVPVLAAGRCDEAMAGGERCAEQCRACREPVTDLPTPSVAPSPAPRSAQRVMMSAHAFCPTDMSHPRRMAWMAEYFLKHNTHGVSEPQAMTEEQARLPQSSAGVEPFAWFTKSGLYPSYDGIPAADLPPLGTPVPLYTRSSAGADHSEPSDRKTVWLQQIVELVDWDEYGAIKREDTAWSWETIGRMALDCARAGLGELSAGKAGGGVVDRASTAIGKEKKHG